MFTEIEFIVEFRLVHKVEFVEAEVSTAATSCHKQIGTDVTPYNQLGRL